MQDKIMRKLNLLMNLIINSEIRWSQQRNPTYCQIFNHRRISTIWERFTGTEIRKQFVSQFFLIIL